MQPSLPAAASRTPRTQPRVETRLASAQRRVIGWHALETRGERRGLVWRSVAVARRVLLQQRCKKKHMCRQSLEDGAGPCAQSPACCYYHCSIASS